ncbi:multi antimicrobial extrusion protein MatE [Paenibacillus sp. WLX1005]|uniref:multi antimicrobial extrusion protein MatE n=1 Tax=Paenibacillus sp. WLX1005 TaxID=3243766 RepID=UPI0039843CF1
MSSDQVPLSWRRLLAFFIPMGLSASLVTISHVIINRTLAFATDAEVVIASYALAMSLVTITERPSTLLRQTCSALVRDRKSFAALNSVTWIFLAFVLAIGVLIVYTPIGKLIFSHLFGVEDELVPRVVGVYGVLMYVSIFSVIRNIYQGIIITNNRTKWLTIGMGFRLAGMYALSLFFISTDRVNSGTVGAIIFLVGMMIEAIVSYSEGRNIAKRMPEQLEQHPVRTRGHVFTFYKPLLFSSFVAMLIGPAINITLGKTEGIALAISSFAIASSLLQLMLSFFTYIHQIVLNFHPIDARKVRQFGMITGFIPALLLGIIAYTPLSYWVLGHIMNVSGELMTESLYTLRAFVLYALVMPWLDYANGLILLRGQTKAMFRSQMANASCTFIMLITLLFMFPSWNGMVGALAQSIGLAAELCIVTLVIRHTGRRSGLQVNN